MSTAREALERIATEGECVQQPGGDCHTFCPVCLASHVLASVRQVERAAREYVTREGYHGGPHADCARLVDGLIGPAGAP